MKLEILGKNKAKFTGVKAHSKKLGQKKTIPAAKINIVALMANTIIEQFSPKLRALLYEKNGQGAKEQSSWTASRSSPTCRN